MIAAVPGVFVVDDELSIAEAVVFALQSDGLHARHFATGNLCIEALATEIPELILLDIGLPDGSGFDFFRRIRALVDTPVIFLTARPTAAMTNRPVQGLPACSGVAHPHPQAHRRRQWQGQLTVFPGGAMARLVTATPQPTSRLRP